jgi:hypothetical protein
MSYAVWFKPGCSTAVIAPAGVRILAGVHAVAQAMQLDLTITCGCDAHGPDDPHTKGNAFDVRSKDIPQTRKQELLTEMMARLCETPTDALTQKDGGIVSARFFGWLEHAGADDEHFHFQLRNGHTYP